MPAIRSWRTCQEFLDEASELDNLGGRGFQRLLYVYGGPRNTSPLLYVDDRKQDFKPYVYFRIRKTFG